jgi:hypothetical protein
MNNLSAVFYQFLSSIFNVYPWAAITGRETNQLRLGIRVNAESTFLVPHGAKTLSSCTSAIPITDDYSDLGL